MTATALSPTNDAPELDSVYAAHRVGALAGVSGYTVGQWARYGLIRPSFRRGLPAHLYSFYDAAEAVVIHWLQERGFSYARIHDAIDRARDEHPDWPLITAPLGIARHATEGDPRGLIVLKVEPGVYVDTASRDEVGDEQVTIRPELLDVARDMLRRGGWLADKLELERIEVDPGKLGGAPSLRGRRWTVERVAQIGGDEEGRAILVDDYGLDTRDVDESLAWVEAAAAL